MLLGIALCVESVSMANVRYIHIVLHTYNAMKNGLSGTSRLRVRSEKNDNHVIIGRGTMELMNSRGAFCLPRSVYLLQTSVAFFLIFHDATFHMRRHLNTHRELPIFIK